MYRHGEIFRSRVSDKVPDGVALSFADFRNSLQHSAEWVKKVSVPKTSSIRPTVSIEHPLVTDRQTEL